MKIAALDGEAVNTTGDTTERISATVGAGTLAHDAKRSRLRGCRRVREVLGRKSGGAAAERGAEGDARSEGERRR